MQAQSMWFQSVLDKWYFVAKSMFSSEILSITIIAENTHHSLSLWVVFYHGVYSYHSLVVITPLSLLHWYFIIIHHWDWWWQGIVIGYYRSQLIKRYYASSHSTKTIIKDQAQHHPSSAITKLGHRLDSFCVQDQPLNKVNHDEPPPRKNVLFFTNVNH